MTSNKYIILLISTFALLLVSFFVLVLIVFSFNLEIQSYITSAAVVLITYPVTMISVSSYLIGRAIFVPKDVVVNKYYPIAFILFVYLIVTAVSYDFLVNDKGMTVAQYAINSSMLIITLVILPMLLARPNRLVLKLMAKVHRGF
jgi:hypothetical protein